MDFVVVLDPSGDQRQRSFRIGQRMHPDIVALEGFHESFRKAVAFGAGDRREAGRQIERLRERARRLGRVRATIV